MHCSLGLCSRGDVLFCVIPSASLAPTWTSERLWENLWTRNYSLTRFRRCYCLIAFSGFLKTEMWLSRSNVGMCWGKGRRGGSWWHKLMHHPSEDASVELQGNRDAPKAQNRIHMHTFNGISLQHLHFVCKESDLTVLSIKTWAQIKQNTWFY